ncbi:MAG: glycosyltransferase [Pseudomonadota bacterium]
MNFSTDDPFNPMHRAEWQLGSLKAYDVIFTPRRSNFAELQEQSQAEVRYLPFAYDSHLFSRRDAHEMSASEHDDVLFVGGADPDRVAFFREFVQHGLRVKFVGSYWDRYAIPGGSCIGSRDWKSISALTAGAAVNVCLVRRANRDGHVMRTFEIPAVGGFSIVEDTADHRAFFREEGECVLYFSTPKEAVEKARWALENPLERRRMAAAAHARVAEGGHTYHDRLATMLDMEQPISSIETMS